MAQLGNKQDSTAVAVGRLCVELIALRLLRLIWQPVLECPKKLGLIRNNKKPTICILTQTQGFGGVEVHTLNLIDALIIRGYRVELISCRHREYDDRARRDAWRSAVTMIHTDLNVNDENQRGWLEFFRTLQGEVLIFQKGGNDLGSLVFFRACRRAFDKVYFVEHSEAEPAPIKSSRRWLGLIPGLGLWWYRQRLIKKLSSHYADRIIAVSNKVRDRLVNDWGYRPDNIRVVHNGVPWRDFTRNHQLGTSFRSRLGIPEEAFVFGMLTRLSKEKGVDIALRGFRLLWERTAIRPAYLLIAGEGPELENLKDLAGEIGVGSHVKFVGFVREGREVLSAFDAIIFSSRVEGLPLALLEGMAAGCVPIITRVGGMPEVLDKPGLGWTVSPENPEELCGAMQSVVESKRSDLSEISKNAESRIQRTFDIDSCHRGILRECNL
jgi:glycosyltransferase involved in cell wall biosynthesis